MARQQQHARYSKGVRTLQAGHGRVLRGLEAGVHALRLVYSSFTAAHVSSSRF